MATGVDPNGSSRVVGPPAELWVRLRDLVRYRELLANLTRKELKVKYRDSALGFVWSLLNPLLYLLVFSVVFAFFLRFGLPGYAFYLLSGLVAWNLLAAALGSGVSSIVANGGLVSKVYFPREILPLSTVAASLIHFLLQLGVLAVAMAAAGYWRHWDAGMALLPLALVVEVVFVAALVLTVASLNVYFRDVQHLLELVLLAWFWMTPIIYASRWVSDRLVSIPVLWQLYLANPMTAVVLGFQRALYARTSVDENGEVVGVLVEAPLGWYAGRLAVVGVASFLLLAGAWTLFKRLEGRLAEEL